MKFIERSGSRIRVEIKAVRQMVQDPVKSLRTEAERALNHSQTIDRNAVLRDLEIIEKSEGLSATVFEYYVLFRDVSEDIMKPLIILEDFSLSNLAVALQMAVCLSDQVRDPEEIRYDGIIPDHYRFAVDRTSEERTVRALQSYEERSIAFCDYYAQIKTVTIDIQLMSPRIYDAISYMEAGHGFVLPRISDETVDYFTFAPEDVCFFEFSKTMAENFKKILRSFSSPNTIHDVERSAAVSLGIVSFDPNRDFARLFLYPTREDLRAFLCDRIAAKSAVDRLTKRICTGRLDEKDVSFLEKTGLHRKTITDFTENVTYIPSRFIPALFTAAICKRQLRKDALDATADHCRISDVHADREQTTERSTGDENKK